MFVVPIVSLVVRRMLQVEQTRRPRGVLDVVASQADHKWTGTQVCAIVDCSSTWSYTQVCGVVWYLTHFGVQSSTAAAVDSRPMDGFVLF